MNRHKFTIFVEGPSELIFVRELLIAWYKFDADKIGLQCYSLCKDTKNPEDYDYGSRESECYYQIISVGNDNLVGGKISELSPSLIDNGYVVVGLRDMYSDLYVAQVKKRQGRKVHADLNNRFEMQINDFLDNRFPPEVRAKVSIRFAVMEVEAWMLALFGVDDVEQIFHPAEEVKSCILSDYDKHRWQTEKIMKRVSCDDFLELYLAAGCQSYNRFVETIIPAEFRNP